MIKLVLKKWATAYTIGFGFKAEIKKMIYEYNCEKCGSQDT
jgi:hypothetical protein